jgi:ribose transport system substrate-binding protein
MFRDPINAAVAAGIPVIAIDADSPDSKRIMFIGTDNFKAGQESAKRMSDILKGQGQIVIVTIPGQPNLDERVRGVTEGLKKPPASR